MKLIVLVHNGLHGTGPQIFQKSRATSKL